MKLDPIKINLLGGGYAVITFPPRTDHRQPLAIVSGAKCGKQWESVMAVYGDPREPQHLLIHLPHPLGRQLVEQVMGVLDELLKPKEQQHDDRHH